MELEVERVGLLVELEVESGGPLVEVEVERVGLLLEVELEEGVELEPLVDADSSPVGRTLSPVGTVGADVACACLARFLAAAFVCQPHEHGLFADDLKKTPCWHFLIAAIAAKTSLFDGFWPLPVNTGLPSAKSISCSAYCPIPRKQCDISPRRSSYL